MKSEQANQILQAWNLAEKISGGEPEKRAEWFSGDIREQANHDRQVGKTSKTSSLLYLGEYQKQHLRDSIQDVQFQDKEKVQNRDPARGYSVALLVNSDWSFQKIEIPYVAYFYLRLRQNDVKEAMRGLKYDDFQSQLSQQLQEIINRKQADLASSLKQANQLVLKTFELTGTSRVVGLRGLYGFKDEPPMLNSFYTEDIEHVLKSETDDALLLKYLGLATDGVSKQEVDQNQDLIARILDVQNLPDGRWPGPEKFFQSLMQQVAINVIRDKGPIKTDLKTVNGPPGTGKTTLLQDVFADTIVQQAKAMAQLKKPMDGFQKIKAIELHTGYRYNAYELIPELQGFGIVVTSNNNSAVANISKDFPSLAKIKQHVDKNGEQQDEYREQLQIIDYFSDLANGILEATDSWGLFAVPMGSKDNQQKVFKQLNHGALKKKLSHQLDSWAAAQQNFNRALEAVHQEKNRLHQMISKVERADPQLLRQAKEMLAFNNQDVEAMTQKVATVNQDIEAKKQSLAALPQKRFLIFWKRDTPQHNLLRVQIATAKKTLAGLNEELKERRRKRQHVRDLIAEQERIIGEVKPILAQLAKEGVAVFNDDFWQQANEKRQQTLPNNSAALQNKRAKLFIAAMRLRKMFVCEARVPISNAWEFFENQDKLVFPEDAPVLTAGFQIMQLLIPVMSTTLASVGRMFANFEENSVDNVYIDESGQATPASAVGIVWRAKNLVAIGDPAQIEPVVTTNEATLRTIARDFGVSEQYLLPTTSVQQLADQGNIYGMHKGDHTWVGLPLWVHRRCDSPMFEIANEISYENKMVQGKQAQPGKAKESRWIDSKGKATDQQFVPEDVIALARMIQKRRDAGKTLDQIFVISPFRAVISGIYSRLPKELGGNLISREWLDEHVGTVHRFQGKEADIVFLVIGTDQATDGGANWAFSKPNLLNVAVTRAKKEFYLIGDYQRLKNKQYVEVAAKYLPLLSDGELAVANHS